jgi:hypothetical protein
MLQVLKVSGGAVQAVLVSGGADVQVALMSEGGHHVLKKKHYACPDACPLLSVVHVRMDAAHLCNG